MPSVENQLNRTTHPHVQGILKSHRSGRVIVPLDFIFTADAFNFRRAVLTAEK